MVGFVESRVLLSSLKCYEWRNRSSLLPSGIGALKCCQRMDYHRIANGACERFTTTNGIEVIDHKQISTSAS